MVSSGEPSSSTTTTTSSSSSDTPASADKSHDDKAAPLRGSASASESSNGGKEGGFASRSKLLAPGRFVNMKQETWANSHLATLSIIIWDKSLTLQCVRLTVLSVLVIDCFHCSVAHCYHTYSFKFSRSLIFVA